MVTGASWDFEINGTNDETKPGKSSSFTFTAPTSPEPKEKDKYILVFQGKMGNEENAVAGKVVSLESDIWEEWDGGTFTQTGLITSTYYYFGGKGTRTMEYYSIETDNHTWNGITKADENPLPSIRVEDGAFKFDSTIGDKYYNNLLGHLNVVLSGNSGNGRTIPVSGCKLKIKTPTATIDHSDEDGNITQFWLVLNLYNGTKLFPLYYGLVQGSNYWDWPWLGAWLGEGEFEQNLETDFRSALAVRAKSWPSHYGGDFIGDINGWYIEDVILSYYMDNDINGYPYTPISVSVGIDYIDFVCEE